jgi:hypothetical protein
MESLFESLESSIALIVTSALPALVVTALACHVLFSKINQFTGLLFISTFSLFISSLLAYFQDHSTSLQAHLFVLIFLGMLAAEITFLQKDTPQLMIRIFNIGELQVPPWAVWIGLFPFAGMIFNWQIADDIALIYVISLLFNLVWNAIKYR